VIGPVRAEVFSGFCFDSRIAEPGQLFVAVRTARADGHDHIADAARAGATGVLCQHPPGAEGDGQPDPATLGITCIVVDDTREALLRWSSHVVAAWGVRVVAITGSVGKTTTKEMIAHALAGSFSVFRNPANYSGRFGLPIALGGLTPRHEIAVLEMAADHFGEIRLLTEVAPPEIGIVTRVAPAHLEAFGGVDAVAREKGALVEALPAGPTGLAILNADDERVAAMADLTSAQVVRLHVLAAEDSAAGASGNGPAAVAGAGSHPRAGAANPSVAPDDLWAWDVRLGRDGTRMRVGGPAASGRPDGGIEVVLPWLGRHFAYGALAAFAVGRRLGLDDALIASRLASLEPVPGRLNPLEGLAGALLLDDTYNASPVAVMAALDVAEALSAEGVREGTGGSARTIVALGDMAELGARSAAEHRAIGRAMARRADLLVTCGPEVELTAQGARDAGMPAERVVVTNRTEDAVDAIRPYLGPGAVVLAKGSAVSRMERVVAALMLHPERAAETLVRQDAGWRRVVVTIPDRPTWLEIDLGAVAHNARCLAEMAAPAALMAVVKADAYGHGAVQVARTALRHGASWLGVACLPEAAALRRAGIDAPILVLGYTPAWQAREAVRLDLRVTVYDIETARALAEAGAALRRQVRVHIKVDTGLHRLGLPSEDIAGLIASLAQPPYGGHLEVEGIFTHLAAADSRDSRSAGATAAQLASFGRLVAELEARGTRPRLAHAANTAALIEHPDARYEMVRGGIALYGLAPSAEVRCEGLRPVLAWKTEVAQVRALRSGESIGYGLAWTARRDSVVATIPVGYADGFRRAPKTWRYALVRGVMAPLVGRVSMDQASLDVTDVPGVRQGDEVVLIGRQGDHVITAETVADWLGTINYEVVSAILPRVARVS